MNKLIKLIKKLLTKENLGIIFQKLFAETKTKLINDISDPEN